MLNILFAAKVEKWAAYGPTMIEVFAEAGLEVDLSMTHAPADVDYMVYAPNGPVTDFSAYTRLRAVLNLWAGVEDVAGNTTLTVPFARMVDASLTEGMVEWVVGHVLRHHLRMDRHIHNPAHDWTPFMPPLARDRHVTVLGLGALGSAAAQALAALNFNVSGWSRSPKDIAGIQCLNGPDGLREALGLAQTLVLLLPLTGETENILNAAHMGLLPKGAIIINPGRGKLIDDEALLSALETGHVHHATLDVFRVEPLPKTHPFWTHPRVTVTPHVASETRAKTAAMAIAENIKRSEAGLPLLHLVDRQRGY